MEIARDDRVCASLRWDWKSGIRPEVCFVFVFIYHSLIFIHTAVCFTISTILFPNHNICPSSDLFCTRSASPTLPNLHHLTLNPHPPIAYRPVINLTNPPTPTQSPSRTIRPTSKFNGLSASPPLAISCATASSVLTSPYAGVHEVLSRSRQISPVLKEMLGWIVGVRKVRVGGAEG